MTNHEQEINQESEGYQIRIKGHLENQWADWFEGLTIERYDDGTTTLSGSLPDQTALHSVLVKIRNMNLKILSVQQIDDESAE